MKEEDLREVAQTQYRALSRTAGRNSTQRVAIPPDLIRILGWTPDRPVRIELVDGSLVLTQVSAEGFVRIGKDGQWVKE